MDQIKTNPKDFIKSNFALLLAFLLPILLIIIVAISVYFPSSSIATKYNFLYTLCTDGIYSYSYDNCHGYLQKRYTVLNNALSVNVIDVNQDLNKDGVPDFKEKYSDRIFLYDTEKKESKEISLEDAKKLKLNDLLTSPDGISISGGYDRSGGDFFIFDGGRSVYGYYLTKGKSRIKINLIHDQYYYQNNFQFIGWVLSDRE